MAAAHPIPPVIQKAKTIVSTYFPEQIYHVTFHRRNVPGPATVLTIYNRALPPNEKRFSPHGMYCIRCDIMDKDPTTLFLQLLTRCGLHGTTHLRQLIDFAAACGLSRITLEDESAILYDTTTDATYSDHAIHLPPLLRLKTGRSWYETFGFTNGVLERRRADIQADIQQPLGSMYPDELLYRIQDYLSETHPDIASNNTSAIVRSMSLSQAASHLYHYLTQLCPQRICPSEEELAIVDDINDILQQLYQGMMTRLGLNSDDLRSLYLILPSTRSNQHGSSRNARKKTRTRRTRRMRRMPSVRRKQTRKRNT